jgi:intein-encoded DNA endonuclease-like protein
MLTKHKHIPKWILHKNAYFFAFVGGYTDAEGSIGVYSHRARFRVGSYDKMVLKEIHTRLKKLHINNTYLLEAKAGTHNGEKHNGDFYRVGIADKQSLHTFLDRILPYLQHNNRRKRALLALNNIRLRI